MCHGGVMPMVAATLLSSCLLSLEQAKRNHYFAELVLNVASTHQQSGNNGKT